MSTYTTVNVVNKANVTLATNVPVQIDNASELIAQYYGGSGYDVFEVYIPYFPTYTAARNDLFIDQVNNDPLISPPQLARYRVVGNPEKFPDGHQEMKVNRFTGAQS